MNNKLNAFIRSFIRDRHIAVLATMQGSQPIVSTVFYVVGDCGQIYFKSRTDSLHSKSFTVSPKAAFAIYDHQSTYDDKTGVQIIGTVTRVIERSEMKIVVDLYSCKFGASAAKKLQLDDLLSSETKSTMYLLDVGKVKLVSHELDIHMPEYESLL